ncbi:hypothetical protein KQX54_006047 [Cotesia glomerata]|uniref:DWNN domain-containing protein n=1 Tax=Cotesia glomerata TaxID=32391 RepID=A0AAV7ICV2_COTGL|nr:hypothetical protein KQX54_006047 [Cotesia glomerata]
MSVMCQLKNFEKLYHVYFDEVSISIKDIKIEVIRQMRVSEDREWEIIAMDLKTKKEYKDEDTVRRDTTILLQRRIIPESQLQERKRKLEWKRRETELQKQLQELKSAALDRKQIDLTKMEGTEEEKIKKMMEMSTVDYAPSKWLKVPFKKTGPVPTSYVCRRCHKPGHWVYQCTFTVNGKPASIKKARGIPKTMMAEVEGPEVPGAMLAATGNYTPNTSDNAWYCSSSDYQGSGYQNSYYGYPVYQPYLGGEPSYQEVDGYPGYNSYNDYSYQQQTQVIDDPLDEFERYLQKKDAEKRNQRHRTKSSRSFEGRRKSPSPSRKRRKYC